MGRAAERHPACFSELRFYRNWREQRKRCVKLEAGARAVTICEDCLPSYQARMKRSGRCSNPDMQFAFDAEGGIFGMEPPW